LFKLLSRESILNSHLKQVNKPLQGVLVHGINARKINNREKQQTGPVCDAPVPLPRPINLLLRNPGVLNPLVNLRRKPLTTLQLVNQRLIQKQLRDTPIALGQALEDIVLNPQEFFLIYGVSPDDVFLLLLELGVL